MTSNIEEQASKASSNYPERIQNALNSFSKCKTELSKEIMECKKFKDSNAKLEIELKETRELEKSHRYHLLTSREMIGNLQETVSKLIYLKRDMNKYKEEISNKDLTIDALEKEKISQAASFKNNINDIKMSHERFLQDIKKSNDEKIQQVQHDCETKIAHYTCVIEELRAKIKDIEMEHGEKMNVVVLEYEEKLQRSAAQITQLHDQHAGLVSRTDASINAYRRRLEELEEKLKQSQFKQYLVRGNYSQYESQVERPYSANRDPLPGSSMDIEADIETPKVKRTQVAPIFTQNKAPKSNNTLQVMYYGNKIENAPKNEKGSFNISKKRKLFTGKEFQDF